jgi:hypothetical protein
VDSDRSGSGSALFALERSPLISSSLDCLPGYDCKSVIQSSNLSPDLIEIRSVIRPHSPTPDVDLDLGAIGFPIQIRAQSKPSERHSRDTNVILWWRIGSRPVMVGRSGFRSLPTHLAEFQRRPEFESLALAPRLNAALASLILPFLGVDLDCQSIVFRQ